MWGYQPAIAQTSDGKIWVTFKLWESGSYDIWYTTSSDGGATWSDSSQFTRFAGYDEGAAATALSSGHLALAWVSQRSTNHDIWYGVIGLMEDINPPPWLISAENEPVAPGTDQTVTVRAEVRDESGIEDVQLVWWVDGEPQDMLPMSDDGAHNDYDAGDGVYGAQIGPFPVIGSVVEYQIQITDIDGNTVLAPQYPYLFEVVEPFVKTADILLVADETYYEHQYYQYYAEALDDLSYAYDVWACRLKGKIGGDTLNQYLDGIVIWSTPRWGYIGYNETMNDLSSYLDNGGNLFISGQYISSNIGLTSFYQDYLYAQLVQYNIGLYSLNGIPDDPITDGLYVSISGGDGANNQYFPNEIDPISPAEAIFIYDPGATAPLSPLEEPTMAVGKTTPGEYLEHGGLGTTIIESSGSGALRVDTGVYKVVYFAFGFEAINSAADRATVMGRVLDWLAQPTLSINDVTVSEDAGGANFTVTLSNPSSFPVTVNYSTADGTATAGSDYTAASGTLTFPAGDIFKTISVPIVDDFLYEGDETFYLNLTNPTNATISDGQGMGTIVDNDLAPELMVEALIDDVVDAPDLPEATKTNLIASLNAALKVLEDSNQKNDVAAINVLKAFIIKVEAQCDKKIPEEVADDLITKAQDIIAVLSLGP